MNYVFFPAGNWGNPPNLVVSGCVNCNFHESLVTCRPQEHVEAETRFEIEAGVNFETEVDMKIGMDCQRGIQK